MHRLVVNLMGSLVLSIVVVGNLWGVLVLDSLGGVVGGLVVVLDVFVVDGRFVVVVVDGLFVVVVDDVLVMDRLVVVLSVLVVDRLVVNY